MRRQPPGHTRTCAACGRPRGNTRTGWAFVSRDDKAVGATCPDCPRWDEPIRRVVTGDRVRFVAVLDGSPGPDGRRRQHKRRHDSLTAARAWVTEVRQGVAAATTSGRGYVESSTLTVREVCEQWLAARASEVGGPGGIREVTLNGYASALHSPLLLLGDRPARAVTPGEVEAALRTLASEGGVRRRALSHRSIAYGLTALRQAFGYAVREGWMLTNPAAAARAPRASTGQGARPGEGPQQRWTTAELARVRAEVDTYGEGEAFTREPWLRTGFRLTLCGLRRSEVLGLDWSGVDLDAGSVRVVASRVKTGRSNATSLGGAKTSNSVRTVQAETIHPGTLGALRALWLVQGRPSSGLVICDAAGEPVHPDLYSRRFRAVSEAAEVPVLRSVHNVRHTLATALQAAGLPDHQSAALLGHDVATFRRFYLVTDDDGAAAAATLAGQVFAV